ncbi:MAG: hypothetical protein V4558_00310 [Gemmatimonadota bacterium]
MSTAARRAEFFALEAGEYLADLGPVAAARDVPDAERLVRGARALRGAALMAGLGTFARAAAGLEGIARQVRDNALAWDPDAREAWNEGLGTLRGLVPRATTWEANDDRQALALVDRLERVSGGMSARPVAPTTPRTSLSAGVRAFIARESALIAGSFAQAARALAPTPPPAALTAVLERMQSLRGLGASAELSPLPELLDAMELATRTLLGESPAPPDVANIFADAAHAMSAIAKALADGGQITLPPTLERVAARLLDTYAAESDVVPIAMLAPTGEEPIVQHGIAPGPVGDLSPIAVELVSVGDHLLAAADALIKPTSPIARDLRLFVLHRTLSTMPPRSATGRFLAPIAEAITAAIGHGVAARKPEAFVAMLRDCGRFLVESGSESDRVALTRQRDRIAAAIVRSDAPALMPWIPEPLEEEIAVAPAVATAPPSAPIAAPVAAPVPEQVAATAPAPTAADDLADAPIVDIAGLAPDPLPADDDIVSIESLAPAEDASDIVSIESLAPEDDDMPIVSIESLAPIATGPGLLERAYIRRGALLLEPRPTQASLEGLTGRSVAAADDAMILPVADILYRGVAALDRAEEVRAEINAILAEPTVSLEALRPWINELLDLVPLARDAA